MTQPFLQLGRLLMQLHGSEMRRQLSLLGAQEPFHDLTSRPVCRRCRPGRVLHPLEGPVHTIMGLLDTSANPFYRLLGLAYQPIGRRDVLIDPHTPGAT